MPAQMAAQTLVGIVYAVFQLTNGRFESRTAFKIEAFNHHIARPLGVSEQHIGRGGHDAAIVLRHDVRDDRKVRAIVEGNAVLAVVDIEIVGHHVLAENKTVFEALRGDISHHVVVILVARHHQTHRVAGIFQQFLFQHRIAHILIETELAIADPNTGNVL